MAIYWLILNMNPLGAKAVSTDYFVRPPVHIFIYNNRALHEHLIIQGALHRVNICPRYIFKTQK